MPIKGPFIVALCLIGLMAVAPWNSIFAGTHEYDDDQEGHEARCTLAGLYIGAIPGQATFTMSNIPLDPSAREVMLIIDITGYGPTFDGVFPTAVGQTFLRGFVTRTSRNGYAGQLVRYRYDAARAVVGTEIQAINVSLMECDTVEIGFTARLFYFGFVNPGDHQLPEPDIRFDVSGTPPTTANKMLAYESNRPRF